LKACQVVLPGGKVEGEIFRASPENRPRDLAFPVPEDCGAVGFDLLDALSKQAAAGFDAGWSCRMVRWWW
jgi:succinate dehydrogenase/fumarate reductase-like Fe-S protein